MVANQQEARHPWGWSALHHPNPESPGVQYRNRMIKIIDRGRLVKRLWFVGASGFFATSYTFFASNVTKPLQYFTFPPCGRLGSNASMVMDELTLIGAAIGMLGAGLLADIYGRKKLYGFELALLIVSTLGIVQASEGFQSQQTDGSSRHTMDFYAWQAWWRFWLGIAIGAELPLVAIITADPSPGSRLTGVGLAAFTNVSWANGMSPDAPDDGDSWKFVADQVWRLVTGIGIVTAIVAVGFRFTIPETPRYYFDILFDTIVGRQETAVLQPKARNQPGATDILENTAFSFRNWCKGVGHILRRRNAGRNLGLLSVLWVMTDISWYCLSLESPSAMATLWTDPSIPAASSSTTNTTASCPEFLSWRTDPGNPNTSVYRELERSATRFMLVVSIGSVTGSFVLIAIINRVHRRKLLMATCGVLALLFAVSGAVLLAMPIPTRSSPESRIAIDVLFGIMHFLFTLGPRTLVLIMAVELFPTMYRGTFYGTAAAAAKIGAIVIRPIIGRTAKLDMSLGVRLMVAVVLMFGCMLVSYHLPDVQHVKESETTGTPAVINNEEGSTPKDQTWVASRFPELEDDTLDKLEIICLRKRRPVSQGDGEDPVPQATNAV